MIRTLSLLFLLVFTVAVYVNVGAPALIKDDIARRQNVAETEPLIHALQARVQLNTKDLAAHATLGQLYMETGKYRASAEAYRHAVLLSGGEAPLILQYNKALIFAAGGEVTEKAAEGLTLVLKLLPNNPEARYFLALQQLQHGKPENAMPEFKALYHELPDDSPLKAVMNRQIGRQ